MTLSHVGAVFANSRRCLFSSATNACGVNW
jgi:hypothetical protein